LWGLRMRDPIWHDGRVAGGTFDTRMRGAIALHDALGSEAQASKLAFDTLTTSDQNSVVAFLDSLGRVEFDQDGDNDVDLADHAAVLSCFTGPGPVLTPDDICSISDADRDGDVDDDDLLLFDMAVSADSGDVAGLTLGKSGGMLQLDWTASCNSSDDDYGVYQGTIGGLFDDHMSTTCSTGGSTTETFAVPAGSVYFLVVPNNAVREGSYGRNDSGSERLPGSGACEAQAIGNCL